METIYALKSKKFKRLVQDHFGRTVGFDTKDKAEKFLRNFERSTSEENFKFLDYVDIVEACVLNRSYNNHIDLSDVY